MYEIDKKKFGAFVAALRKEKGYTQKELGEKLFLSDKAISKWETGVSIPDTAMLVPLAEILEVSVTELLRCEKGQETMDETQVEELVQTAIRYSDKQETGFWRNGALWKGIYLACLVLGGVLLLVGAQKGNGRVTPFVLGAVFGGYYCWFSRAKLPSYYDAHKISGVADGVFRMNIPGLYFNNSNWPYIVLVIRIWACLSMSVYPLISLLMGRFAWWSQVEPYVYLTTLLGGLFVPAYVVGKKYQ